MCCPAAGGRGAHRCLYRDRPVLGGRLRRGQCGALNGFHFPQRRFGIAGNRRGIDADFAAGGVQAAIGARRLLKGRPALHDAAASGDMRVFVGAYFTVAFLQRLDLWRGFGIRCCALAGGGACLVTCGAAMVLVDGLGRQCGRNGLGIHEVNPRGNGR